MTPDSLKEWATAAGIVGGTLLAAWKRGARISTWCHDRWTSWRNMAALRAAEQAEAEKTVRVLNETITLLELHKQALEDRNADLMADVERRDAEIVSLRTWVTQLQAMKAGSPR